MFGDICLAWFIDSARDGLQNGQSLGIFLPGCYVAVSGCRAASATSGATNLAGGGGPGLVWKSLGFVSLSSFSQWELGVWAMRPHPIFRDAHLLAVSWISECEDCVLWVLALTLRKPRFCGSGMRELLGWFLYQFEFWCDRKWGGPYRSSMATKAWHSEGFRNTWHVSIGPPGRLAMVIASGFKFWVRSRRSSSFSDAKKIQKVQYFYYVFHVMIIQQPPQKRIYLPFQAFQLVNI